MPRIAFNPKQQDRRLYLFVVVQMLCFWAAPYLALPLVLMWPSLVRSILRLPFRGGGFLLAFPLLVSVAIHPEVSWQALGAMLWLGAIWTFDKKHFTTNQKWISWSVASLLLLFLCNLISNPSAQDVLVFISAIIAGDLASFLLQPPSAPSLNAEDADSAADKPTTTTSSEVIPWREVLFSAFFALLLPWTFGEFLLVPLLIFLALVVVAGLSPTRSLQNWGPMGGFFFGIFLLGSGAVFSVSPPMPHIEGQYFWVVFSLAFWVSHTLITVAQTYREALEESECTRLQLELALEATEDCAWEWDLETDWVNARTSDVNSTLQHFAERRSRFANWTSEIHPKDGERVVASLLGHLDGDFPFYESKHRVPSRQGNWRWVLERGRVTEHDDNGAALRMLGTQRDITYVHEADERRLRLETQLEQNQRLESLGLLAGGVAHDFNNLLAAVIANLDLALEESRTNLYLQHSLEDARGASMRAAELCKHLLAYAGRRPIESEVLRLNAVVTEMHHLLRASISPHIEVNTEFSDNTPCLAADGSQVRQVLMNLLLNSADAIGKNNHGAILVRTGRTYVDETHIAKPFVEKPEAGEYAFLEVKDNGCGMPEEVLERLFDPFFSTKRSGRGLGMAAVIGIVRGHEGGISVESTEGEGTTFRVYWPVATDADVEESESCRYAMQLKGKGRVALIVEDEAPLRRVLRRSLQKRGFEVLTAENGFDGLHVLEENADRLAILISDVMMPGPKGWDLLRMLRNAERDIPVLLMSGLDGAEEDGELLLDVNTRFLPKPFAISQFERVINDLCDEHEDRMMFTASNSGPHSIDQG
ncbi:MAG: response regulator [Deltaproteobacteria bacterium]|nr:response regulator [Deltaproteobacteria bacterium]